MTVSEQSIFKSFRLLSKDAKGNFLFYFFDTLWTFIFITGHLSENFVHAAYISQE
jgi:hypothetical protein